MSFKKYLDQQNGPSIVFTFGRFNPMHQEHYLLSKSLLEYKKKNKFDDAVLYTSLSTNVRKNPLTIGDKVLFLRKMVPNGVTVSDDMSLKNSFQILEDLIKNKKYTNIVFIVGDDRVRDFQGMYKYAKDWGADVGIDVLFKVEQRKGNRKSKYSGTRMRQLVKDGDFEGFLEALPASLKSIAKDIFDKTKVGLGL